MIYGKKKTRSFVTDGSSYLALLYYLCVVCDPVMGDWGRLYVAPEIVPLYRDIMQVANVVTPNQFEAE